MLAFARAHSELIFAAELWQLAQNYFCPNEQRPGLTSDFEVALVLAEKPYFKMNFFFTPAAGSTRGEEFLRSLAWPLESYLAVCQKSAAEPKLWAIPHGLAFSLLGGEPDTVNVYFMPRR